MSNYPAPAIWEHEFERLVNFVDSAKVSRQAPIFKKSQSQHIIMDEPENPLIDGARYRDIVNAMSNAVIFMHKNKTVITDRSFAVFGFTPHQVHYCHADATVLAIPHLKLEK